MKLRKSMAALLCILLAVLQMSLSAAAAGGGAGGTTVVSGGSRVVYLTFTAYAGEGGSISPEGRVRVKRGDTVTFTITPDEGYAIDDVLVSGRSVGPVDSCTFEDVKIAKAVQVTFRKKMPPVGEAMHFQFKAIAGEGGTIDPSGITFVRANTEPVYKDFTIIPDDGYHILDVLVNGESVGAVSTYHFVADNMFNTIEASFESDTPPTSTSVKYPDIVGHKNRAEIETVVGAGLFSGTSETTFDPDAPMTRAMFVTVLGRYAKAEPVEAALSFSDVAPDAYYAPYVAWAAGLGVVSGTGEGQFSPDLNVSRQEMAVFVDRYLTCQGAMPPYLYEATAFSDSARIAPWAEESVTRMQLTGLVDGGNSVSYRPDQAATRAEVASLFARLLDRAGREL